MARPQGHDALTARLADNRARLLDVVGKMADVTSRDLLLPEPGGRPRAGLLLYLEAIVDNRRMEQAVLKPLLEHGAQLVTSAGAKQARLPVGHVTGATTIKDVVSGVLRGEAAVLVDGHREAVLLDLKLPPARAVEEVKIEPSVHGSIEGFTSLLETNLSLLRRRLPTPDLRLERRQLGSLTQTTVVMAYVHGKANQKLVEQTRRRLARLNPETLFDTEDLVTALSDRPKSLMPTVLITERPDLTARYLASGHVAVLADNSPKALLVPGLLIHFLTATDDFLELRPFAVLVTLVRMLALFNSIFLPGIYVAVITFHEQAIPTLLTLSLLAQREGAPLPTPVEALLMVVTFEILREAGLRLPRPVGPSVSIVGGLVIGEAAMRAGVTSPAMVLVVSATAISTFAIPSTMLANVATILRLIILGLASVFGFFGLIVGYAMLIAHLAGLTTGRVPYATPYMPLQPGYFPDAYTVMPRPPEGPGSTLDPTMVLPPGQQDREQQ